MANPGRCKNQAALKSAALMAVCVCLGAAVQGPNEDKFHALLKQGFELHQQARFAQAIPLLEQARGMEPGDYFVNLLLGIDLLRSGKVADALPHLKAAARAKPGEDIPQDYLGEAEARLGHYAMAAEAYQIAFQRNPRSEQAQEAWAGFALERFRDIGYRLRATSQGLAAARRLQQAAANSTGSIRCTGSVPALERILAVKRTARQPAVPDHAAAKRKNTNSAEMDVESAYQLSFCYAIEAGKVAAQLQKSGEDQAAVHRLRGDVLLRLKEDGNAAQAEYRQAIALNPGDPALLERLAQAQLTAGETDKARESAKASLAMDPHRREALRTLASLAMSSRDYDEALPPLRQLAAEAPDDISVRVQLGKALAQTGEAQDALRWLGPALAAGYPDEKGALHAILASTLRKLGREAEAAKAGAEARRLSDSFQARTPQSGHEAPDEDQ